MVSSEFWFGAEAGFYNSVATQSLRFDGTRATTLYRDIAQAGNRKIATYAFWLKFDATDTSFTVFSKGDGGGVQTSFDISIDSSRLRARFFESDSQTGLIRTNRLLRDASAWYHIVVAIDVSQGTSSDRVKLYINGTQETSLESSSYPSDSNTVIGNNSAHTRERIGDSQMSYFPNTATGGSSSNRLNGYLCDFHHVDGQQLTPSSFGEFKNGVWIAKHYTGNHGDNGFRLEFKQTGDGQSTASSSTIGADTGVDGSGSATNNHFKDQNFEATDCNIPDSPENNWATLNSIYKPKNNKPTFSEGNLKATASQVAYQNTFSTIGVSSGKWYVEMKQNGTTNSANFIGIVDEEAFDDFQDHSHYIGSATVEGVNYGYYMHNGQKYVDGTSSSYGSRTNDGEIIGIALDLDNGKLYFSVDGTFVASGNPVNGTNFMAENIPSGTYFFGTTLYQNGYTSGVWNFGQDSSFGGTETATSNSDANGNGTFHTAPPTGFLALCSANLPEPTISPNSSNGTADEFFNTVLYTGNATDNRSITGFGLKPDWLWIKNRSNSASHHITDTSRGGALRLRSNSDGAEENQTDRFTSIDTDGFTITGSDSDTNANSNTYVAWGWKANGTTPTKTYKVVVVSDSGNKYRFRNSADSATFAQSAVTLDLQEGGTYTFDWSDSSAQGHPIRFSLTANGTHGGGSEYTTGVVKDDSAYKTTITVASGVATLYYYCQYHSGMGGQINTNTTFGSTNFDGSLLSVSNPNTTSGFSIITYTGGGSAGDTIGHGLNSAPEQVWFKRRGATGSWMNYVKAMGNNGYINLDRTNGKDTGGSPVNNTDPSSTVITLGSFQSLNSSSSNNTYIAYAFAPVDGYSKLGSYIGNGSTDGAFVFTGFRPAWIMTKETSATSSWNIYDNARSDDNPATELLIANSSNSEGTGTDIDIVSNGFKVRSTSGNINTSGNNYIYMAFAETPFKFANAR